MEALDFSIFFHVFRFFYLGNAISRYINIFFSTNAFIDQASIIYESRITEEYIQVRNISDTAKLKFL
jgi:hypothetical protein